jgi:hypothetical protein
VLQAGAGAVVSERDVARAGGPFDLILLDRAATEEESLLDALAVTRRALSAEGHLWVFEGYDTLENAHQRVIEHPLARLRRLLSEAGLRCERLSPLEADGEHVLAACARPALEPGARVHAAGVA